MGLADRHYMREPSGGVSWSATVALIATLCLAFICQRLSPRPGFIDDYLALSLEGIRHGYVWELLTYQFLHGGWIHLLMNCLVIYFVGRELEFVLGKSRFFTLYFLSGVMGGLLQMLGAWVWPQHMGGTVVGASAGAFGLVAAFAMRDPERQLMILLYFILPLRIRAKYLLVMLLMLAVLGMALPGSVFGGNVAHAAHLGGIFAGVAWVKLGWHLDYVRLPWENWRESWQHWFPSRTRRRKRELIKTASMKRSPWGPQAYDPEIPSEEFISREVDPILDKITAHGIQSLTERERRILEDARNKMAKR